ncbi:hypothetical protein CBL_05008 [Carabus blaptoides fortunei]
MYIYTSLRGNLCEITIEDSSSRHTVYSTNDVRPDACRRQRRQPSMNFVHAGPNPEFPDGNCLLMLLRGPHCINHEEEKTPLTLLLDIFSLNITKDDSRVFCDKTSGKCKGNLTLTLLFVVDRVVFMVYPRSRPAFYRFRSAGGPV